MKLTSATLSILCILAAAGLAIGVAVERQASLKLDQENKVLQQQLSQMDEVMAENQRLSNLVARANSSASRLNERLEASAATEERAKELVRLRGEVAGLRQQSKEIEAVRTENRQARAALESSLKTRSAGATGGAATADYWPKDSWSFNGYASPDAALQSSVWAANNGDVKALLASATGELRELMEKDLAGKSADEASIRAMDEVSRLKSVRVLNRDVQSDDTAVLTVGFEEGADTRTRKLLLKKIGNEWKLSGSL